MQLYEATGRTDQAAEWKQKLAEFEKAETAKPPAAPPPLSRNFATVSVHGGETWQAAVPESLPWEESAREQVCPSVESESVV